MENKRKLSAIFGGGWCIVAAIAALIVFVSEIITKIMTIINTHDIPVYGKIQMVSQIIGIIAAVPMVLIGIGLLLTYIKGRQEQLHTTGITMVKVSVMIRGIITFVLMVIVEVLVLISTFVSFAAHPPASAVLVLLLINAFLVYYSIVIMMYTIKMDGILRGVRDYDGGNDVNSGKSVAYVSIFLTVISVIGLICSIIMLFASAILTDFVSSGMGGMGDILSSYTPGLGSSGIFSAVFSVVRNIGMIILFVMSFVLNGKIKRFPVNPVSHSEKEYDVAVAVSREDVSEDDQATVQLDVEPEIQVKIPEASYNSAIDPKVFEGKITSLNGADKGISYPIRDGEEIIIGKDPNTSSIVIDKRYEKISRRHCGIKYDAANDIYQVIDYSMNGTYINSVRQLSKGIYVNVPKGTIINLAKENLDYKLN